MKHPRLKYFKILIPALLLIGVMAWFLVSANMPNKGSISNPPSNKASNDYYDKILDGTHFKFQYSSRFLAKNETATNGDLERYVLIADTRYDKRILASVTGLPDGRLESNGGYIFRQSSSSIYSSRTIKVGSDTITIWVKKDGTEQTAIIPNGQKAAVISFVTINTNENLTNEIDTLLSTFRWKQSSIIENKKVY